MRRRVRTQRQHHIRVHGPSSHITPRSHPRSDVDDLVAERKCSRLARARCAPARLYGPPGRQNPGCSPARHLSGSRAGTRVISRARRRGRLSGIAPWWAPGPDTVVGSPARRPGCLPGLAPWFVSQARQRCRLLGPASWSARGLAPECSPVGHRGRLPGWHPSGLPGGASRSALGRAHWPVLGRAPWSALRPRTYRTAVGARPDSGRYIGSADARSAEPRIRSVA